MSFKKGDKVAVLDAAIKGVVINASTKQIVIEDEDGFELSFRPDQLVKILRDQNELSKFSDINNPLLKAKIQDTSRKKKTVIKSKKEGTIPPMEVDLHIQHLVKSTAGMQNFDMLTVQLDTAKMKIEFAQRKRIPRIIFIHGVGEGVLKDELYRLLKRYPVKISDASYQKYGMGATEVYFLQNK